MKNNRQTQRRSVIAPISSPAEEQNYNTEDCVETASVDSFPASDPPGWICVKVKPDPV